MHNIVRLICPVLIPFERWTKLYIGAHHFIDGIKMIEIDMWITQINVWMKKLWQSETGVLLLWSCAVQVLVLGSTVSYRGSRVKNTVCLGLHASNGAVSHRIQCSREDFRPRTTFLVDILEDTYDKKIKSSRNMMARTSLFRGIPVLGQ